MLRKLTPVSILIGSALVAALLALSVVGFAHRQPWLGLNLQTERDGSLLVAAVAENGPAAAVSVGTQVTALVSPNGEPHLLEPSDLLEEPDVLPDYEAMAGFFARQDQLAALLRQPVVTLLPDEHPPVELKPAAGRPLSDLPTAFWVQLFVGGTSFLIGAWVLSLRRDDLASRILAAVGASTLTFSFAAAAYSIRELAIDGAVFRALSALNHFGALGFGACMIALFLTYPRRIVPPRALLALPAVFFPWWLADTLRIGFAGPAEGSHLPTLIEMLGILGAAGLQYWKTRGDARARAAMRWFGLSVAVGAGAFVFMVIAPNLFGATPLLSQGYAFLFFLLVFAGVALGVARYRLFELETWAFRILFYLGGLVVLLIFDSVLIFVASMDRAPALSVSLMATALLYLPLRSLLTRRLMSRKDSRESLFRDIVDVALAVSAEAQAERWRTLLQRVFDPLRIEPADNVAKPLIADDGVSLALPRVGALPSLRLVHARGGRKLFSRDDAELAAELCAMLGHAVESRSAYEKGVAEERARIARDMHDNIGAQLLTALHQPAAERKDSMIRETLSDIRSIINNDAAPELSLEETLAELRQETADRVEAAGLSFDWSVAGDINAALPPAAVHALRSVVREAVSNTLKHARATSVSISAAKADDSLELIVADNGAGLPVAPAGRGNGLGNMRDRVAGLGGTVDFAPGNPGLKVVIRVPATMRAAS